MYSDLTTLISSENYTQLRIIKLHNFDANLSILEKAW